MRHACVHGLIVVVLVAAIPASLGAAGIRPETLLGWEAYVRATEERITRELSGGDRFLSTDFTAGAEAQRRALLAGDLVIVRLDSQGADGRPLEVPEGMVHHWRGSVFIPGASLDRILARVANPRSDDTAQEDVVAARVIDRGPGSLRLFLRLQRSQIVTVVYNTEHAVRYVRHGERRASSRSIATRIAEVAEPATPREWERRPGEDRGFLWRLNSYWRYEQAAGGVLVECESISLSRTVPSLLRGAVRPIIDQVARGSMERTLVTMRARFADRPSQGE